MPKKSGMLNFKRYAAKIVWTTQDNNATGIHWSRPWVFPPEEFLKFAFWIASFHAIWSQKHTHTKLHFSSQCSLQVPFFCLVPDPQTSFLASQPKCFGQAGWHGMSIDWCCQKNQRSSCASTFNDSIGKKSVRFHHLELWIAPTSSILCV